MQDIEQVQTNVVKIAVSVCQNEILVVKKNCAATFQSTLNMVL